MQELFTIGHSSHSLERFLELLASQGVSAVVDVRSDPYSRYQPQYNKNALEQSLKDTNIKYIFLGRELGARRCEESCYIDGQVKFDLIAELPVFCAGLDLVLLELDRHRVALMCAEAEPLNCHRTILICRQLKKIHPDLRITHILGDGATESAEQAEQRLVGLHDLQPGLFGEPTLETDLIEKAYDLQAAKIAFRKAPSAS